VSAVKWGVLTVFLPYLLLQFLALRRFSGSRRTQVFKILSAVGIAVAASCFADLIFGRRSLPATWVTFGVIGMAGVAGIFLALLFVRQSREQETGVNQR
jgi:uncharacterized membrane protein YuzA (DUF378 family)